MFLYHVLSKSLPLVEIPIHLVSCDSLDRADMLDFIRQVVRVERLRGLEYVLRVFVPRIEKRPECSVSVVV